MVRGITLAWMAFDPEGHKDHRFAFALAFANEQFSRKVGRGIAKNRLEHIPVFATVNAPDYSMNTELLVDFLEGFLTLDPALWVSEYAGGVNLPQEVSPQLHRTDSYDAVHLSPAIYAKTLRANCRPISPKSGRRWYESRPHWAKTFIQDCVSFRPDADLVNCLVKIV